jgi:hypothetical protein
MKKNRRKISKSSKNDDQRDGVKRVKNKKASFKIHIQKDWSEAQNP